MRHGQERYCKPRAPPKFLDLHRCEAAADSIALLLFAGPLLFSVGLLPPRPTRASDVGSALTLPPTGAMTRGLPGCVCEGGGTGRRAGLRSLWGNPCGFESRLSHHLCSCKEPHPWSSPGSRISARS